MVLQSNFIIALPELYGIEFSCESGYISDGVLFIKESYKWDGCTYGINTERTYTASLIHDFLYEYAPVDRLTADNIFYNQLKRFNFQFSALYYLAVRIFGGEFYKTN
jgi:hypothetical protein